MEVFISWSGDVSRQIAASLHAWLPQVLQTVTPWCSSESIESGARWPKELGENLERIDFGIICLTPDNPAEKWIHFEAGALSKRVDQSRVCPLLYKIQPNDIVGPLAQFQARRVTEEDILKLVLSIDQASHPGLGAVRAEMAFNKWWPDLFHRLQGIKAPEPGGPPAPGRSTQDIVEEVLQRVRSVERLAGLMAIRGRADNPSIPPPEQLTRTATIRSLLSEREALAIAKETADMDVRGVYDRRMHNLQMAIESLRRLDQRGLDESDLPGPRQN